jgi:hypothetical protein
VFLQRRFCVRFSQDFNEWEEERERFAAAGARFNCDVLVGTQQRNDSSLDRRRPSEAELAEHAERGVTQRRYKLAP